VSASADARIARHKRRLYTMLGVDALAVLAAFAFIFGRYQTGEAWMMGGFAAAVVVGFAAQVWLVVRWWQDEKAAGRKAPQ